MCLNEIHKKTQIFSNSLTWIFKSFRRKFDAWLALLDIEPIAFEKHHVEKSFLIEYTIYG